MAFVHYVHYFSQALFAHYLGVRHTNEVIIRITIYIFSSHVSASCDEAIDQVGYRICISQKAENSAQEVKAKQDELLNKIKSWDQEPEFRDETIKLFKKAIKSFDTYKEHQCRYEWSAAAGGNGASSMGAICTIRLNNDYLKSLNVQLSWYEA